MADVTLPKGEKEIRSILELFGGRFNREEVTKILQYFHGDTQDTANFLLSSETQEINQVLGHGNWTLVARRQTIRETNPQILETATSGRIVVLTKLFACGPCDSFWWRRVPQRKQVSRCKRCRQRYDPVPDNKVWGLGEFSCPECGHFFRGWGQMHFQSACHLCGALVRPTRIIPPMKGSGLGAQAAGGAGPGRGGPLGRGRGQNQHSCVAHGCYNRDRRAFRMNIPEHVQCVHPRSRQLNGLPKVVEASQAHTSSGSTIDTFLSQADPYDTMAYQVFSLPTIHSESEGSDDGGGED